MAQISIMTMVFGGELEAGTLDDVELLEALDAMRNNVLMRKDTEWKGRKKCSISVFREEAAKIYSEGCFFITH